MLSMCNNFFFFKVKVLKQHVVCSLFSLRTQFSMSPIFALQAH